MLSSPFPLSALPTGPMPSGITGGSTAEEKPQKPLDISPTLWYNTRMKKKAFVFDLDGTLFETTAQEIESAHGHARYIEFSDTEKLLKESKPRSLVSFALTVQSEGHRVYVLTARNSLIYRAIRTLLERYGIDAEYVFCVGDRGFDIPEYKAEILSSLAETHATYFFDDCEENLSAVPDGIRAFKA